MGPSFCHLLQVYKFQGLHVCGFVQAGMLLGVLLFCQCFVRAIYILYIKNGMTCHNGSMAQIFAFANIHILHLDVHARAIHFQFIIVGSRFVIALGLCVGFVRIWA